MKKIITSLFFVLLYVTGYSQWSSIPSYGGAAVARSGSFAIGDTGYIIAGGNSWYVPAAYGYDTLNQTWFQISDYPGNDDDPISFSINGKGYCVTGGTCCPGYSNTLYQYDPNTGAGGTWTALAPLPGAGRTFCVGFQIGTKLYVGGGVNNYGTISNSNPLNDFFSYDVSTGIWDSIAPCPALGVNAFASGFAINGEGYVGCGDAVGFNTGSLTPEKDFWEYDPGSNAWTQKNDFPGGVLAGATSWATCSNGYICGGYTDPNQSVFTSAFWQYNPTNDTWTQLPSYGGGARDFASAFLIGRSVFVGNGATTTQLSDFWEYIYSAIPAFKTGLNSDSVLICAGQSVAFTDTSNYSPSNWNWSFPGGTPDTSNVSNPTIQYNTPGRYNVTLTAFNSCDSSTKIFTNYVTVTSFPDTIKVTPLNPSVCNGQTITLTANGGAGATYQWVGTTDTTDSIAVNPKQDTTYDLLVSNGSCSKDALISVKVNNAPPLVVNPPSPAVECNGQPILITVPASGSDYTWYPATGLSATTGSSVTANPTGDITYTVTGIDSLGCTVSNTEAISIQYGPNKPTITVSVTGDTLFSSAKNGDQWYLNGTPVNGATDSLYVITGLQKGDSITVSVINVGNGCSTTSDAFVTGINQLSVISNQLSIYPNPTNGMINVTISSSATGVKDWNLRIIDVLGRTLYTRTSLTYYNEIDLSALPGGVYFITVINKTGSAVVPVVKQN